MALLEVGILKYAYTKIGIDRRSVFLVLLLSLVGSYINIPVATAPRPLITARRIHPRAVGSSRCCFRQWRTIPACDSVNAVNTPTT